MKNDHIKRMITLTGDIDRQNRESFIFLTFSKEIDQIFKPSPFTEIVHSNQRYDKSKAFDQLPIPGFSFD
jgi:hypothetical protein